MSIKAGVPLYNTMISGTMWIFFPLQQLHSDSLSGLSMWRCDLLSLLPSGEITGQLMGGCYTSRFLNTLCDAP